VSGSYAPVCCSWPGVHSRSVFRLAPAPESQALFLFPFSSFSPCSEPARQSRFSPLPGLYLGSPLRCSSVSTATGRSRFGLSLFAQVFTRGSFSCAARKICFWFVVLVLCFRVHVMFLTYRIKSLIFLVLVDLTRWFSEYVRKVFSEISVRIWTDFCLFFIVIVSHVFLLVSIHVSAVIPNPVLRASSSSIVILSWSS
jgi:hypothetical protein